MSSLEPRGLQRLGLQTALLGGAVTLNPLALPALPVSSPRIMGEIAYGAGRTGALAENALAKIGMSGPEVRNALLALYQAGNTENALRGGIGPRYDENGNPR